jgi:hypothetical protein
MPAHEPSDRAETLRSEQAAVVSCAGNVVGREDTLVGEKEAKSQFFIWAVLCLGSL